MVRVLVVVAAVALTLAGVGSGSPTGGLYGVVIRGPVAPVCRVNVPCDEPAAAAVLFFNRAGRSSRVVAGGDGSYRITLVPGVYTVRISESQPAIGAGLRPRRVHVVARMLRLGFSIDTGIR